MSYTIKPVTQYAVINDDNGLTIALCKDMSEATAVINSIAVINSMAGHGAKPYNFSDWARKR